MQVHYIYIGMYNIKSMTIYVGSIAKENYENGCHLTTIGQNDQIFDIPNLKFMCLILWLGEVCTDINDYDDARRQNMIV